VQAREGVEARTAGRHAPGGPPGYFSSSLPGVDL